jgi:hypothetical protein
MADEQSPGLDLGAAHLRPAQREEPEPGQERPRRGDRTVPWEGPRRQGRAAALAATWWQIVRSPVAVWAAVPTAGGMVRPWTFALLCGGIFGVISELTDSATVALIRYGGGSGSLTEVLQLDIAGRSLDWLPISMLSAAGCLFALLIGTPLYLLVYSLLLGAWVVVLHALLKVSGGLASTPARLEGTLRAVCYSQVAVVAAIVPWVGDPTAVLWSFALQVPALRRMHRCSRGRALFAVGLPAILLVLGLTLLLVRAGAQATLE